jgi:hypothetical protein
MAVDLFPMGFIEPILDALNRNLNYDGEYTIVGRPLNPTDPNRTIGVFPATWVANPDEKLIGMGNREPYESVYNLAIHNLIIHGDAIEGRRVYSIDSKAIRAILYRDEQFHVTLGGLTETFMGSVERVKKYDVLRQEFMVGRTGIGFTFLCKTEFIITTEITKY